MVSWAVKTIQSQFLLIQITNKFLSSVQKKDNATLVLYVILSFTKAWGSNPDLFFSNNVLQASDSLSGIFTIVPWVFISVLAIWAVGWFIVQKDLNEGIGKVSKILLPVLCLIVVFALCSKSISGVQPKQNIKQ